MLLVFCTFFIEGDDILGSAFISDMFKRETVIHLNKVVVRPLWSSLELNIPFTRLAFYMRSI